MAPMQGRPFLQDVAAAVALFIHFEKASSSQEAGETVYGSEAAKLRIADVKRRKAKGENVTIDEVEPIQAFRWLLSPQDQEDIGELVSEVVSSAVMVNRASAAASSRGPKRGKAAGRQASKKAKLDKEEEDATMDLFA